MNQIFFLIICKKNKKGVFIKYTLYILKKKDMKKFITENFANIILAISLLTLMKTCGDSRELSKIRKEIKEIKDSTFTKKELEVELRISGLEAEKRMIQATDRKILDVQRQTQIDEEIKKLRGK
jgi:hypothetical protein